jgi:hypothetical protein
MNRVWLGFLIVLVMIVLAVTIMIRAFHIML